MGASSPGGKKATIVVVCFLLTLWLMLIVPGENAVGQRFRRVVGPMGRPAIRPVSRSKAPSASSHIQATSRNFTVVAPDAAFAQRIANDAERYRKELAIAWLGHELPPWTHRCPITVKFTGGAGGRTSFAFFRRDGQSVPGEWEMEIFGPPERILDSVLPHEVTHTIFATHFGRPLPRWADEGACTTVEHASERQKNHRMLLDILSARPSRGIPFNQMFTMREYPRDIFPLYAQGYSLSRYLLQLKDRRAFIRYIERGLEYEDQGASLAGWDRATQEIYGHKDLSELQMGWLTWVKNGSPDLPRTSTPEARLVAFEQANDDPPIVALAKHERNGSSGQTKTLAASADTTAAAAYQPGSVGDRIGLNQIAMQHCQSDAENGCSREVADTNSWLETQEFAVPTRPLDRPQQYRSRPTMTR